MGSFNTTCALSGMPITCGDDVKFFLLTENPYEDSLVCSPHDMYFPRSTPISAKYNDYGSIDNFDEDGPGVYAIVAALAQDMIEVGTGNNSCHDVPTSKGMSFEETLNAVWESRILITREFDWNPREYEVKEGIPTLQRISKLLNDSNCATNDGYGTVMGNDGSYLVDEAGQGWVRIREAGYGSGDSLIKLLPLLKDYAAVITAGSSDCSNRCEIQVMPLPAEGENRSFLDETRVKKPCKVFQVIILQEVWDALCAAGNYKKYRKAVQEEWDSSVRSWAAQIGMESVKKELLESSRDPEFLARLRTMNSRSPRSSVYSFIPFTMGIGEHFSLATERHATSPFTDEQIDDYLGDVAGFNCVQETVCKIRYWWRPTFSVGQQWGGYEEQADWHKILVRVSEQLTKKYSEEDEDAYEDCEEEIDTDANASS